MITCPNSNTGSERFERLNVDQGEPGRDRLPVAFRAAPPRGCSSGVRGRGSEVVVLTILPLTTILADGTTTRFKYKSVRPESYGLSCDEILFAKDNTLKQFVSLKEMVPYNEGDDYHPGHKKRKRFRDQLKEDYNELLVADRARAEEENNAKIQSTKKKRRQKKKSKNGDGSDATSTHGMEGSVPAEKTKGEALGETDIAVKKTRKKKGKKIKKNPTSNDSNPMEDSLDAIASTADNELEDKPDESETKKSKKTVKRKKKKKSIEGISASRLASYGL